MNSNVEIRRVSGRALPDYLEDVARLRIEVFRDFPYLYDGTVEYEEKYLQRRGTGLDSRPHGLGGGGL